jgi:hypothetical protein
MALVLGTTIWNYDLRQLTPSGTLEHQELFRIRILLTLLATSMYLLSLLILTLLHYKKDIEPLTLTPEEHLRITETLRCPHCDNKIFDALTTSKSHAEDIDT